MTTVVDDVVVSATLECVYTDPPLLLVLTNDVNQFSFTERQFIIIVSLTVVQRNALTSLHSCRSIQRRHRAAGLPSTNNNVLIYTRDITEMLIYHPTITYSQTHAHAASILPVG